MIIKEKKFFCRFCDGIKFLKEDEPEPEVCPFCGKDDKTYESTFTSKFFKKE